MSTYTTMPGLRRGWSYLQARLIVSVVSLVGLNFNRSSIYNDNNLLVNKIAGFDLPNGVEMRYNCGSVLIADYRRGTYSL